MNLESLLNQILNILKKRHVRDYKKNPSLLVIEKMTERVALAFWENRIIFQLNPKGHLDWFFIYAISFRGDFNQTIYLVTDVYCHHTKNQKNEKKLLKSLSYEFERIKKAQKLSKAIVNVDLADLRMQSYFNRKGELTAIELLGKVSDGLQYLNKKNKLEKCKIRLLRKSDIEKCIHLDIESHVNDPTSRMRHRFKQTDALDFERPFYQMLVKNKGALIATKGKDILGVIGFFIYRDISHAMIACIFVSHKFKGRGIAQYLYKNALLHFQKEKCQYYLGSSTTKGVLELAIKMKRKERSRAYVLAL